MSPVATTTSRMGTRIAARDALARGPLQLRAWLVANQVGVIEADPDDLDLFTRIVTPLGTYVGHPLTKYRVPEDPRLLIVSNLLHNKEPIGIHDGGAYWHTDMSYRAENTIFTALLCVRPARMGGETRFLDTGEGWERIRTAIRDGTLALGIPAEDIRNLRVVHRFGNRDALRNAEAKSQDLRPEELESLAPRVTHPLIQRHPLTGREFVYAVAGSSFGVNGLSPDHSRELLDRLFDALLQLAPRYEHRYRGGDIVIWDNLTTLHCGPEIETTDDPGAARILYRTSINYLPSASAPDVLGQ